MNAQRPTPDGDESNPLAQENFLRDLGGAAALAAAAGVQTAKKGSSSKSESEYEKKLKKLEAELAALKKNQSNDSSNTQSNSTSDTQSDDTPSETSKDSDSPYKVEPSSSNSGSSKKTEYLTKDEFNNLSEGDQAEYLDILYDKKLARRRARKLLNREDREAQAKYVKETQDERMAEKIEILKKKMRESGMEIPENDEDVIKSFALQRRIKGLNTPKKPIHSAGPAVRTPGPTHSSAKAEAMARAQAYEKQQLMNKYGLKNPNSLDWLMADSPLDPDMVDKPKWEAERDIFDINQDIDQSSIGSR